MQLDPVLSLALTMHTGKGVYALLLGSGVSRPAMIPTGFDVMLNLVRRVAKLTGENCEPDPAAWFKQSHGEEPDYAKLLDVLAPTPEQRQQILRGYFEPTADEREQGLKQPTKAHGAVARLVANGYVRVILTTNFDRLIERAIEQEGITPVVVSTHEGLAGCLPLAHQNCTVIKLHGDYLDIRVKNTPNELATYEASIDSALDRILDEYGLIVSGWSGKWDTALRAALERCKTRRFGFFWTSIHEPSETEKRLAALRGGSIVHVVDADTFFDELETKLATLDESVSEHPLEIESAVAAVKRYSAKPEYRIRLHDLLARESEVVFTESETLLQAWRSKNTWDGSRAFLMAATERMSKLRRMIGYAAYWGGEDVLPPIIKCIARLSHEPLPMQQGGTLRNDWYRAFLGANLLYAAGLALVLSNRFALAAKLATEAHSDGHSQREPVAILFTRRLREIKEALSHGQQTQQHVPFSELMLGVLNAELADLSSSAAAFETAFEEWELLLALIYGELQKAKLDDQHGWWVTPGRYVYQLRWQHRSQLYPSSKTPNTVEACQAQQPFVDLIVAGFFGGKWDRLVELRNCVLRVAHMESYL